MVPIQDVFAMIVPEECTPDQRGPWALPISLLPYLMRLAQQSIDNQYANSPIKVSGPVVAHWLVTNVAGQVEEFQPSGHCQECARGNALSREFLLANPNRYLALANLTYFEDHP